MRASEVDIGYQDQSSAGSGTAATGSKPESKLWWNDGFWWGSLYDAVSGDHHIFKLDGRSQKWVDTGVTLDPRPGSRADTLWDGGHLYVASHQRVNIATAGQQSLLYRFSYDPARDRYTPDQGFPVSINDYATETLVIEKAGDGTLWATWVQDSHIYV
ncbi:MAG: hypothetical protein M3301_09575, partial [Chloroflexota bacterium]|nr:hypothetical protein [Chloroflexota bacterium]